jgi:hypothetical protein
MLFHVLISTISITSLCKLHRCLRLKKSLFLWNFLDNTGNSFSEVFEFLVIKIECTFSNVSVVFMH